MKSIWRMGTSVGWENRLSRPGIPSVRRTESRNKPHVDCGGLVFGTYLNKPHVDCGGLVFGTYLNKPHVDCGGLVFGTYLNRDYTISITWFSNIAAVFQSMCFSRILCASKLSWVCYTYQLMRFFLEILFNVVFISYSFDVVCIAALTILTNKKQTNNKTKIINLDGGEQLSSNFFFFLF